MWFARFLLRLILWPVAVAAYWLALTLAFWPFFERSALLPLAAEVLRPGGFHLFHQSTWTAAAIERVLADPLLPIAALAAAAVVMLTCVFFLLIIVTVGEAKSARPIMQG